MKGFLARIAIVLIAASTILQMIIDWLQSKAAGLEHYSTTLKILVIGAGTLALLGAFLPLAEMRSRRRH